MTGKSGAYNPVPPRGSMNWMDKSLCQWEDPRLFDALPGHGWDPALSPEVAKAKVICEGCPVRDECLTFGLVNMESGVRGGEYLIVGKRVPSTYRQRVRPDRAPRRPVYTRRGDAA